MTKKNPAYTSQHTPFFTFLFLFLLCGFKMTAQYPTASNPDYSLGSLIGGGSFSSVNTLNSDMLEVNPTPSGDQLWAVVYDGVQGGSPVCGFYITYNGTNPITQNVILPSGARNPDIVIANDISGSPNWANYIIAVVYENGSDVYLATYNVSGVGSPSPTIGVSSPILPNAVVNLSNVTGSDVADYPHIDLFGDHVNNMNSVSGPLYYTATAASPFVVSLHEFAITWHLDNKFSGQDEIWACVHDFNQPYTNPGAYSIPFTPSFSPTMVVSGGVYPDIAAQTIITPGASVERSIFIAYHTPNGQDLMMLQNDYNGSSWGTPSTTSVSSGNSAVFYPRIDAIVCHDYNLGGIALCGIVASVIPTGSTRAEIQEYGALSNVSSPPTITAGIFNMISTTDDYLKPVITVAGDLAMQYATSSFANLGEGFYLSALYSTMTNGGSPGNGDLYYSEAIPGGFGVANEHEINLTAFTNAYSVANQPALTASTSTNTGYDILVAWYDGNDILYKLGGNSGGGGGFKPTSVSGVLAGNGISLYPNPATNQVELKGIETANYTVSDIAGHVVNTGKISAQQNKVDISSLAAGMYFIELTNSNSGSQTLKFIKQ